MNKKEKAGWGLCEIIRLNCKNYKRCSDLWLKTVLVMQNLLSTLAASKILFIKMQHMYITILQINVYIITIGISHHVICLQTWLIWFYAALLCFDSLIMVPCGSKHIRMISVIL